ncbi:Beta-barrel assembly machine subunit BamA [Roseicitreum antarcticum]|uniref:Outer membrane protein assembly factor BamA n=2 Tax=Roseicitreum antarcticum TaxID=564137 RepID=A0A1H3BQD9_9RHOB|nr:Beta-barrel assembly machine subunit BamA [Roseicitreum antarcticum]
MFFMACAGFFTPADAQSYRFNTVTVEGNQLVDAATVAGFARINRGTTVSAAELNAAFQRLTNSGLFETVDLVPSGSTLRIIVSENPIIARINFEGNRRLDDEALNPVVLSQPGRVLSPTQVEADVIAITELYAQRGRFAAEVTPRIIPRGNGRVDLAFEIREGRVVEIERVSFVGNNAFSDYRLRRVLDTKQAGLFRVLVQRDTFVADRISFDQELLRDFYLARGYVDFQVLSATSEIARERDSFFVTFNIREGQQFRFGNITVVNEVEGLDPAPYAEQNRLRTGDVFTPTTLDTTLSRMERVAVSEGRRFVRVEPRITRNERNQTLDIELAIVRGERTIIERIDIQGNTTTQDRVIRRQFRASEGDPLNPREIREAAERIRALGYFADVAVDARNGSSEDTAIVDVEVEETTTGSLGFGLSYGVGTGVGFNVTFSETNFLGRGQRVNFALGTIPGSRQFSFGFVEPATLGRDLEFGINAGYTETSNQNDTFYDTRTLRGNVSLTFPVGEFSRLQTRIGIVGDVVQDVTPGLAAGVDPVADPAQPGAGTRTLRDEAQGRQVTGLIGYTYSLDTRRGGFDPNRGYFFEFAQDFGAGSDSRRYIRTTAKAGYEQRLFNDDLILRAEIEGGALAMLSGESRVTERFTLNGIMRGFEANGLGPYQPTAGGNNDRLGGNYYVVARAEAEFPIGLPEEYGIKGGVFMDVGSLWNIDNPGAGTVDGFGLRAAAGVSLYWETPIGPLRFDFSQPVRKQAFDQTQNFDLNIVTRF